MGRHACLGFQRHQDTPHCSTLKSRHRRQLRNFGSGQHDIVLRDHAAEGKTTRILYGARGTQYEIEVFLSVVFEVNHFVIYSKGYFAFTNLTPKQTTMLQEIEYNSPTRDLGMMIAT